jgi:hypothetical protein
MNEEKEILKSKIEFEDNKPIKSSFPSNSHKDKAEGNIKKEETKKIEKVVTGSVIQKKKSLGKKFMETFIGEDIKNVKSYVIFDVVIPAAKDTISDIVQGITDTIQGSIEVSLFGETRRRSSRSSRDRGGSYVSYNSYSSRDRDRDRDRRDDRRDRDVSSRNRARHNFDDIILETRGDAEEVRSNLVDLIEDYGQASVSDLYDLVGVTGNFTDDKWGWDNLASSSVSRVRDGYVLNLPKPIPLD